MVCFLINVVTLGRIPILANPCTLCGAAHGGAAHHKASLEQFDAARAFPLTNLIVLPG